MDWQYKKGIGKLSKWTVVKVTGLALTIGLALNINNITQRIEDKQIVQGEIIPATLDSSSIVLLRTFGEQVSAAETLTVYRDTLITRFRDSTVVTLRDSLIVIPVYETRVRDSLIRRTVWDTIRTNPAKPKAWELYRGGKRAN